MTLLPPLCISVFWITLCCLIFVKKEPLLIEDEPVRLPKARTAVYGVLFALSIVIVFHFIPYWIGLIVVPFALLFLDRNALKQVDYGLLFTFVAFFIFAGNMARIPAVERLLGGLIAKNPLVVSAASCQVISNVPSAILLSQFTSDWRGLLVGVNIGGTGTLISSLASLITFREYTSKTHGQTGKYILWFSLFNFGFLFTLTALEYFIFL